MQLSVAERDHGFASELEALDKDFSQQIGKKGITSISLCVCFGRIWNLFRPCWMNHFSNNTLRCPCVASHLFNTRPNLNIRFDKLDADIAVLERIGGYVLTTTMTVSSKLTIGKRANRY
jgi:hypothetical protein